MAGAYVDFAQAVGRAIEIFKGPGQQGLLAGFGGVLDQVAADVRLAAAYARIEECPEDGLDRHLRSSGLPRLHGELLAFARTIARRRWDWWEGAGTELGLLQQLQRVGLTAKVVSYLDLLLAGTANPFGGNTGFFYLEFASGFGPAVLWNDPGPDWNDAGLWDTAEPWFGALADLRAVVRRWKPPGWSCRFFRVRVGNQWVTVPVGEAWEYDADGNVTDYYLTSY